MARPAAALTEAIRADEAASGRFDIIFFGNESADSGGFQVGARVAHALGRPCVTGLKWVAPEGTSMRCEQESRAADVYVVPLPAVLTVKEGLNLPRYPSVPGRMRAGCKPVAASTPSRPGAAARAGAWWSPADRDGAESLGTGAARGAGCGRDAAQVGRALSVLVLVEQADGKATDPSLQALTLARSLGSL